MAISELRAISGGRLPTSVATVLLVNMERPTLGSWLQILTGTRQWLPKNHVVIPELESFISKSILPRFLEDQHGEYSGSLLELRNRVVHSGGLATAVASKLLDRHQVGFEALMAAYLGPMESVEIVGAWDEKLYLLRGLIPREQTQTAFPFDKKVQGTYVVANGRALPLSPLIMFRPVAHGRYDESSGAGQAASPTPQIYYRAADSSLLYTSIGRAEPETEQASREEFNDLFQFAEHSPKNALQTGGFHWNDFLKNARLESASIVGRREELETVKQWLKNRKSQVRNVGWIQGPPGIGKSVLMAKVAADASHAPAGRQGVFYHRFRAGDARNSIRAFLMFLKDALDEWEPFRKNIGFSNDGALIDQVAERLKTIVELSTLGSFSARFIIIADGLDEIAASDPEIVETITSLAHPGTVWILAGRAEYGLDRTFGETHGERIFSGTGLQEMPSHEIWALLMQGLGSGRFSLVARDEDQEDGSVRNAFVEAVIDRAAGLPLYVKLLIEDLRNGVLTVKDEQKLPQGLSAYYTALVDRMGMSTAKRDLPLLVCLLTRSAEPLDIDALATLLAGNPSRTQKYVERCNNALHLFQSLLRRERTPEDTMGYTLYHQSFREFIGGREALPSDKMSLLVGNPLNEILEEAEERFQALAAEWKDIPAGNLRNHLFRNGTRYAQRWGGEAGMSAAASRLIDFEYLEKRLGSLRSSEFDSLEDDYNLVIESHAIPIIDTVSEWEQFVRRHAHLIKKGRAEWGANRILVQLASEQAPGVVRSAVDDWLEEGRCEWTWLRRIAPLSDLARDPCVRVMDGHTQSIQGVKLHSDGRIISWSDAEICIWNESSGRLLKRIEIEGRLYRWITENIYFLSAENSFSICNIQGRVVLTLEGDWPEILTLSNGRIVVFCQSNSIIYLFHPSMPELVVAQKMKGVIQIKASSDKLVVLRPVFFDAQGEDRLCTISLLDQEDLSVLREINIDILVSNLFEWPGYGFLLKHFDLHNDIYQLLDGDELFPIDFPGYDSKFELSNIGIICIWNRDSFAIWSARTKSIISRLEANVRTAVLLKNRVIVQLHNHRFLVYDIHSGSLLPHTQPASEAIDLWGTTDPHFDWLDNDLWGTEDSDFLLFEGTGHDGFSGDSLYCLDPEMNISRFENSKVVNAIGSRLIIESFLENNRRILRLFDLRTGSFEDTIDYFDEDSKLSSLRIRVFTNEVIIYEGQTEYCIVDRASGKTGSMKNYLSRTSIWLLGDKRFLSLGEKTLRIWDVEKYVNNRNEETAFSSPIFWDKATGPNSYLTIHSDALCHWDMHAVKVIALIPFNESIRECIELTEHLVALVFKNHLKLLNIENLDSPNLDVCYEVPFGMAWSFQKLSESCLAYTTRISEVPGIAQHLGLIWYQPGAEGQTIIHDVIRYEYLGQELLGIWFYNGDFGVYSVSLRDLLWIQQVNNEFATLHSDGLVSWSQEKASIFDIDTGALLDSLNRKEMNERFPDLLTVDEKVQRSKAMKRATEGQGSIGGWLAIGTSADATGKNEIRYFSDVVPRVHTILKSGVVVVVENEKSWFILQLFEGAHPIPAPSELQ